MPETMKEFRDIIFERVVKKQMPVDCPAMKSLKHSFTRNQLEHSRFSAKPVTLGA